MSQPYSATWTLDRVFDLIERYNAHLPPAPMQRMRDFHLRFRGQPGMEVLGKPLTVFACAGCLHLLLFGGSGATWGVLLAYPLAGLHGLFMAFLHWFESSRPQSLLRRLPEWLSWVAMAALVSVLAHPDHLGLFDPALSQPDQFDQLQADLPRILVIMVITTLIVMGMRQVIFRDHLLESQRQADQQRLEAQLQEAQLRLLHAQIQPHFLFNALGAVQQLAETGDPRAGPLTANLIRFLRACTVQIRAQEVRLVEEFGVVHAYLDVMKARLGARLAVVLDLPAELEHVRLPSLALLTLVENAVKHGIEPALRGGSVQVRARAEGDWVRVSVSDTGAGLAPQSGQGVGIDNLRHRLELAYGPQASLTLDTCEDEGTVAAMRIPLPRSGNPILAELAEQSYAWVGTTVVDLGERGRGGSAGRHVEERPAGKARRAQPR
jgi:signal transduction histidine kinase